MNNVTRHHERMSNKSIRKKTYNVKSTYDVGNIPMELRSDDGDIIVSSKLYKKQESNQVIHLFRTIVRSLEKKTFPYISSLNVGVEIETCVFHDKMELETFEEVEDCTIKCNNKSIPREYVYYRKNDAGLFFVDTNDDHWSQLDENINKLNTNREDCKDTSCGLHYHISSEDLRKDLLDEDFIKCFEFVLYFAWNFHYQHEFYHKFSYQKRRYNRTYAHPNVDFLNYQDDFLKTYRNERSYRPYLTYVKDGKYIHVEFRGLSPDVQRFLLKEIKTFVVEVKKMYNIVYHIALDLYHYMDNSFC